MNAKGDVGRKSFGGVMVYKNVNVKGLREESREIGDSVYTSRLLFGGNLLQRGAGMSGSSYWGSRDEEK